MSAGEKIGGLTGGERHFQLPPPQQLRLAGAPNDGTIDEFTSPPPRAPVSAAASLVVFHELAEFLKPDAAGTSQRALAYANLKSIHEKIKGGLETAKKGHDIQLTRERRELIDRFLSTLWAAYSRERQRHVGIGKDAFVEISEESASIFSEAAEFTARCKSAALFRMIEERIADFRKNADMIRNPSPFEKTAENFESRLSKLQERNPLYDISAEDALAAATELMAAIDVENFKLAVEAQIEMLSDSDGALAQTRADFEMIGRERDIVPKREFDAAIAKFRECSRLVDNGEIQAAYALYTEEMNSPSHERIAEFIERSGRHLTIVNLEIGVAAVLAGAIAEIGLGAALVAPSWMPEAAWQLSSLYMRGITFAAYHELANIIIRPELSFDDLARNPASTNARNLLVEGATMAGLFGMLKYGGGLMRSGIGAVGKSVEASIAGTFAAKAGKNAAEFFELASGFMGDQVLFIFWEYLDPQLRLALGQGNPESVKFMREHILTIGATVDRALFLGALRLGHIIASPVTGRITAAAAARHREALNALEMESSRIIGRMTAERISYADGYARLLGLAKKARARWAAIPGVPAHVLEYFSRQITAARIFYARALEEAELETAGPRIMGRRKKSLRRGTSAKSHRRPRRRIPEVDTSPKGLIAKFTETNIKHSRLRAMILEACRQIIAESVGDNAQPSSRDNLLLAKVSKEDFPKLLEKTFELLVVEVEAAKTSKQGRRRSVEKNALKEFFQLVDAAAEAGYEMPFTGRDAYKIALEKYASKGPEAGGPADGQPRYEVTTQRSPERVASTAGYVGIGTVRGKKLEIKIENLHPLFKVEVKLGGKDAGYVSFERSRGAGYAPNYTLKSANGLYKWVNKQAVTDAIVESFKTAGSGEKPRADAASLPRRGALAASGGDPAEDEAPVPPPGESPDPNEGREERLRGNFAPRPSDKEPPQSEVDYPGRNAVLASSHGDGIPRALELLEEVLARDNLTPQQRLEALIDKGICLRRAHRLTESTKTLENATTLDTASKLRRAKPHREFALALLLEAKKMGKTRGRDSLIQRALDEIDAALVTEPKSPFNHSIKAEILMLRHRFNRAFAEIEEAIRMTESSDRKKAGSLLYHIKADVLREMGGTSLPTALDAINEALEIRPDSAKHRILKAKILAKYSVSDHENAEKRLSEAIKILEDVESEYPDNKTNYEVMIDVLLRSARLHKDDAEKKTGFYEGALGAVEKLESLESNNPNVKVDKIEALAGLQRNEEAIEIARKVSDRQHKIPKTCCRLAEIMSGMGEHDLAIKFAKDAVRNGISDRWNHLKLVEVYEAAKRFDYAEAAAKVGIEYFEEKGQDQKIRYLVVALIRVRLKMGRNNDALRAVEMALETGIPPLPLAGAYEAAGITDLPPSLSQAIATP